VALSRSLYSMATMTMDPNYPQGYTATTSTFNAAPKARKVSAVYRWILFYGSLSLLPLTGMVLLLISLVFRNEFSTPNESNGRVYLIDYNLSDLLTISSWCATIAVLLAGFVMTLFSYVVARGQYVSSTLGTHKNLPTPQQYAISVQVLQFGGLGSLWTLLVYGFTKKKHAPSMPSFLKTAGVLLATALLLGWGITAADTWVHVSSSTVPVTVRSAVSSGDVASYGRQLGSWCLSDGSACTLNPGGATVFLNNDTEATLTAFDRSTQNFVSLEGETVLLLPANPAVDADYSATSFGLRTSCKPASRACGLEHPFGRSYRFDCTAAGFPIMKGDLARMTREGRFIFANDSAGTQNMTFGTTTNPFRFGAGAWLGSMSSGLWKDPEIVSDQVKTAIILCETEVLDATYTSSNGSISIIRSVKTENEDLVRSVSAIQAAETFWGDLLIQAMVLAGTEQNSTAMADSFARSFSRIWLALTAGVTEAVPNTEQWIRREPLISRIPKAPFWTLVGFCIGYVVLIFWIVVMALIYVNGDPENVAKTKMRFNVEAIASTAYEQTKRGLPAADVSELFEENDVGGQKKRVVFRGNQLGGMDLWTISEPSAVLPYETQHWAG
jgi:hypothetical protein